MAQMSWRSTNELYERVRRAAADQGRSINEYVTLVLDVATDPDRAGTEMDRVRERLAAAGLLARSGPARRRPPAERVARARAAAGRGTPLSRVVDEDR